MERFLPWLAVLVAAAIGVVAFIEIDSRSGEDDVTAIPTLVPSPTFGVVDSPTPGTTAEASPTDPEASPSPSEPEPTLGPEATETPTTTVAPPPTPTPTPEATSPPPVAAEPGQTTPVTGGGAFSGGLALMLLAGLGRLLTRPR